MDIKTGGIAEISSQREGVRRPGLDIGCLCSLLRFHGFPADPALLAHLLGAGNETAFQNDLIRLVRRQDVKSRALSSRRWQALKNTPLPAIAWRLDGNGLMILAKVADDKALIQDGRTMRPEAIGRNEFEALWDRSLILLIRRASLAELSQKFGIRSFVAAMHKYRRPLTEVLVASFILQLFGLVIPLFFQVVVNKVWGHRSLATLDVLIAMLLLVSLFETVLGILKTRVFSHTTNRIDVVLGAQLFRHLVLLPFGYFGAKRVGDSVARVRELENSRQPITGSSLTVMIDIQRMSGSKWVYSFVEMATITGLWFATNVSCKLPLTRLEAGPKSAMR